MLVAEVPGAVDAKALAEAATKLAESLGEAAAVLLAARSEDGKQASLVAAFGPKVCACVTVCVTVCVCVRVCVCVCVFLP